MERAVSLVCWGELGSPTIRSTGEVAEELHLGEGRTNQNFIATLEGGRRLFVRIGADLPAYGVERAREQAAARAAAAAGIGPSVVHTEADALVCDFLPGRTLTAEQLRTACSTEGDPLLPRIAAAVRALHACPVPPECAAAARPGSWAPADVLRWLALAESAGYSRLPIVGEGHRLLERIEAVAGPAADVAAFCHLDLLPDNFVADGESLWLIDYEYAAAAQPLLDLAILSMGSELTTEAEARLLAAYMQQPAVDAAQMRTFGALKLLACLRETMWGVTAEVSGTSALSMDEAIAYTDKNYAAFQAARDAFFAASD